MKNQSLLVRFISWILGIVVTVVVAVAGAYVVIKMKYDIDIFVTINQVRALTQQVNEDELLTNKFQTSDLDSAVLKVNAGITNLIVKNEQDEYVLNDACTTPIQDHIKVNDKEWGALLNALFIAKSAEENPIMIGEQKIPYSFVQFDFSDFDSATNSVKITTVFKLDATVIKSNMNGFVASLIKNYIPDYFYLFTTTTVTKSNNAFEYTLSDQYLKANNLSVEDTMSLFSALNKFLGIGEPSEFAGKFVNVIADGLLNSEQDGEGHVKGFMSIMKAHSATDFAFIKSGEVIYLEVIA